MLCATSVRATRAPAGCLRAARVAWKPSSASASVAVARIRFGRDRAATHARVRSRRSRGRPRSNASARCCRPRLCSTNVRVPLQHTGCCRRQSARRDGRARCALRPPRRRSAARRVSSRNASKIPIALLPPPTHAIDDVRQSAGLLEHLLRAPRADHRLKLADHQRIRMRPERGSRAGSACRPTLATQSRIASLMASFSVLLPASTRRTVRAEQPHAERRSAPDAACPRRPCRRRTRGRAARTAVARRDAVLPRAGFGDDARLAHALGKRA